MKTGPLNFLVVQDSTLGSIELECILEDLGHRVSAVAVTPAVAMARLADASSRIDAVVFGAMLLQMPAYQLAREVARLGLPAAVTSEHDETFVRTLGFDLPFIAKPFCHDCVAAVFGTSEGRGQVTAA